jgi:demethylmenaquinone methyltransferase/2-methoxy-6-polyprenyl-1,4-benzoquinol methylase
LAAGTLDISMQLQRRLPNASIISVDPSRQMLRQGREKLSRLSTANQPALVVANGEALSLASGSFDGAVIAFGIRNFTNRAQSLSELYRVLKTGARLVILELGTSTVPFMATMTGFYVNNVIPRIGGLLSGPAAYRYLPRSMARFPLPEAFAAEGVSAGFKVVKVRSFMFAVCNLFIFEKTAGGDGSV